MTTDCYATFVYEPYQNGFGNPVQDTWQRSELSWTTGGWWTTGGFGAANGFGGCGTPTCPTLAEWTANLNADFATAQLIVVSVGIGSYNPGQIGYFDNVVITGTTADATYDFEPAPAFETVGECVSTLIAESCAEQTGRDRANCNHAQQMTCFDIFGVQ